MKYLIHLLSALVPKRLRASWREEWRAEISAVKETHGLAAAAKLASAVPIDAASSRWTTAGSGSAWRTDLKQTVRSLLRSPSHVAVVSLCLGIGIAVCTTTFSILNSFMYGDRPGIEERGRLPRLHVYGDGYHANVSLEEFAAFEKSPSLTGIAAEGRSDFSIRVPGHPPMHAVGAFVNGEFFQTLGTRPLAGRLLAPGDDRADAPLAVVLGHAFWHGRLGAPSDIVGQPIVIADRDAVVVGIAPEGFSGLASDDVDGPGGFKVYVPMAHARTWPGARDPKRSWFNLAGRVRGDLDVAALSAELQFVAARLEGMDGQRRKDARIVPVANGLAPGTGSGELLAFMMLLMAAPMTVLAIGCANVANLQLVRASLRARELAVRASLGASRGQIVRLLTLEVGFLVLGGFAVAALLIYTLLRVAATIFPVAFGVDYRVLIFCLGVAALVVAATGLLPALAATRGKTADGLRSGGRSIASGNSRIRRGLVVAQVSLCFLLLLTAAVFTRGLMKEADIVPPHASNITVTELRFDIRNYVPAARRQLLDDLEARLRGDSRVVDVGFTSSRPARSEESRVWLPNDPADAERWLRSHNVTPTFFTTANIPIVRGRAFRAGETAVVIDDVFIEKHKVAEPVLGQILKVAFEGGDDVRMAPIVGVAQARPVNSMLLDQESTIYIPLTDRVPPYVAVWVRSPHAREMVALSRDTLAQSDPNLPAISIRTLEDYYLEDAVFLGYIAKAASGLGSVALVLAVFGLYSVMAFFVALRINEFGIRVALGARAADITRMVIAQATRLVLIGLGVGAILAVPLLVAFSSALPFTEPYDPLVIGPVAILLILTAMAAAWVPARRASAIDASVALRTDA